MELSSMRQKNLVTRVKEGWTIADFMEYYGCTRDELKARAYQVYSKDPRRADKIWKGLEANEKIHRSNTKNVSNDDTDGGEPDAIQDATDSPEEQPESSSTLDFENMVSTLKAEEDRLSQTIISLEAEWQKEKSTRMDCLKRLRKIETEIKGLRDAINDQYEKCKAIIDESNGCAERMNDKLKSRNELRQKLDGIRAKLETMSKLIVGVSLDGGITEFEDIGWELDDSGHEEIFQTILESDACAELKLKEIRAMARLLAISKHAPVPMEIISDNPDVEYAFSLLVEAD